MAEKHIKTATNSLTAAARLEPASYIQKYFLTEFTDAAFTTWADLRGLVGVMFGDLPNPLLQSTVTAAVTESAKTYSQMLENIIAGKLGYPRTPIYGEFVMAQDSRSTTSLVQPGDIRPMLAKLAGGGTDVTIPLNGSITSGVTMRDWLGSNGIKTNQKIWLYGYENEPRRTFNGHLQMDGLVFEYWDDDGLKIAPQDAWIRRRHYAPGDHWGCACVVGPYIPNFDAPYEVEFSQSNK